MKSLLSFLFVFNFIFATAQGAFAQEKKSKKFFRKVGRGLGDGLTTGAKYTALPFLASTSFLSGFFQAEEIRAIARLDKKLAEGRISPQVHAKRVEKFRNRIASVHILRILSKKENLDKFEAIHKAAMDSKNYLTVEDFIDEVSVVVQDVLIEHGKVLSKDFVTELISDLVSNREEQLTDKELEELINNGSPNLAMLTLDEQLKLLEYKDKPSLLRAFDSFRAIETLTGPLTDDVIVEMFKDVETTLQDMVDGRIEDMWKAQAVGIYVELSSAIVSEVVTTSFLLSLIPSISFGVASIPVLAMNVGAGVMVWQCMTGTDLKQVKEDGEVVKLTTRKKIEIYQEMKQREDELDAEERELFENYGQLAKICNRALHDGILKLFKVRTKSYIKGKDSKVKFNKWVDGIKERMRRSRERRRENRLKRLEQKSNVLKEKWNIVPN